jgi:hypothetical protein
LERRWSTGDDPRCLRRFSVDWFSERSGCQVVISVRHPAAVVSSLKRLGWTFDFEHRLRQPLLVAYRLQRFRGETEAALRCPDDVIFQGSLLWRMIYSVVADLSAANHELCAVRQEDLSREPRARLRPVFDPQPALLWPSAPEGRRRERCGQPEGGESLGSV